MQEGQSGQAKEEYVDKRVIRMLDKDIKQIVEGLKSVIEEEHNPLAVGVE